MNELEKKCSVCKLYYPLDLYRLQVSYNKKHGTECRRSYCKHCESIKDMKRKRKGRAINKNYGYGLARLISE